MFCYKCGNQVGDEFRFCPFCGTNMEEVQAMAGKAGQKSAAGEEAGGSQGAADGEKNALGGGAGRSQGSAAGEKSAAGGYVGTKSATGSFAGTDQKLKAAVESFMAGDASAFDVIYSQSNRYLYYTIMKSVGNRDVAEDVLQETYLEIYKSLPSLRSADAFKGWAARVAQSKISRYFSRNKESLFLTEEEMDDTIESETEDDEDMLPETAMQNRETARLIMEMIDDLPDSQREAIVAFYYNQMSINEIAGAMNMPENTVKTNLRRGKERIKNGVLELEKKHGTKLYGVVPFTAVMLFMFGQEAEASVLPAGILAKVTAAAGAGIAGGASAGAGTLIGTNAAGAGAAAGMSGGQGYQQAYPQHNMGPGQGYQQAYPQQAPGGQGYQQMPPAQGGQPHNRMAGAPYAQGAAPGGAYAGNAAAAYTGNAAASYTGNAAASYTGNAAASYAGNTVVAAGKTAAKGMGIKILAGVVILALAGGTGIYRGA